MGTTFKKNTKWIIFGIIILVVAILVAVGPILVTKYMRAKWQNGPRYKTADMMMKVDGVLKYSTEGVPFIDGANGLVYVLEGLEQSLNDKIDQECSVLGRIRVPSNNEVIDGKNVRLFIGVKKINFKNIKDENIEKNVDVSDSIKEKSLKKSKFRLEVNAKLNKQILFDISKGVVSTRNVKALDGQNIVLYILTDEFNDKYILFNKDKDLSNLVGKEIICLGRSILPPSNIPTFIDEINFEIYEVYDLQYNRLI